MPQVAEHRRTVVRRLLRRGLSAITLEALLPGWAMLGGDEGD